MTAAFAAGAAVVTTATVASVMLWLAGMFAGAFGAAVVACIGAAIAAGATWLSSRQPRRYRSVELSPELIKHFRHGNWSPPVEVAVIEIATAGRFRRVRNRRLMMIARTPSGVDR